MSDGWLFETAQVKLAGWTEPFGNMFTAPTWRRVLVLLIGAVLSPGCRTVAAALRVTGLYQDPHFTNHHRVLNRSRWSSRRVARCLFRLLVSTFVPSGPVIIGLDDTLERRWGAKIAARGIYRDPTRSSHGHFVKASGLRWLSIMILPKIAWAGRVWGLPFLTALAPSERYASSRRRRHKKLTDWGRQLLLQTARWLPDRQIIGVADSSYAAIDLLNAVRGRVCMITRLRLDARLFDPPVRRRPGTIGRPRIIGTRQASLADRLIHPKTRWRHVKVTGWYGRGERTVEILSGVLFESAPVMDRPPELGLGNRTGRSRGPAPSFGEFVAERFDSECVVYILRFEGPIPALFPCERVPQGWIVAKLGRTNDIGRRIVELSAGFPPGAKLGWRVLDMITLATAAAAQTVEQSLLTLAEDRGWTLGGEFVVAPEAALLAQLKDAAISAAEIAI